MNTQDVNGEPIARGDWVMLSDALRLDDPTNNGKLGAGQVVHIFTEGAMRGLHVTFQNGQRRIANTGMALRKVEPPEL